ncbi:MAG: mandelate racemase [Rhodospirillales bacterium]|nr:mandelate racemase [Rhodospirillales bacterium]
MRADLRVARLHACAFRMPTDRPEADGTLAWDHTVIVVVEAEAGGVRGLGYTYAEPAAATLVNDALASLLEGADAFDIPAAYDRMRQHMRNVGACGLAAMAISAVDAALWDLKARLLDMPLARLLGMRREAVPVYGSGGFTTYDDAALRDQLAGWVERDGCRWVKMKIGSDPDQDAHRMGVARAAIGAAALFIDANGALSRKRALAMAEVGAGFGVRWFEEPVSSDDLAGLRLLRDRMPASIEVAAGEYVWDLDDARRMLAAEAVDVQQADATRCGGITGFLAVAALCDAQHVDLSGHCAPSLHCHVACAAPRLRHLEYFHDHVRLEALLFDGAAQVRAGAIAPDLGRPGMGLTLKAADAARYAV